MANSERLHDAHVYAWFRWVFAGLLRAWRRDNRARSVPCRNSEAWGDVAHGLERLFSEPRRGDAGALAPRWTFVVLAGFTFFRFKQGN
jgi:hypothetical protein